MEELALDMWVVLDDDSHIMIGKVTEEPDGIIVWVNDRMFVRDSHNVRPLTKEFINQIKKEVTNG